MTNVMNARAGAMPSAYPRGDRRDGARSRGCLLLAVVALFLPGVEVTSAGDDGDQNAPPTVAAQFTERVPNTAVSFNMIRLPASQHDAENASDSAPGSAAGASSLIIAETEVTWQLYDIFVYGLDVPEGEGDIDGVTRPSKPYVPPDRGFGHHGYPAMGMTAEAAIAFCEWLSARTGRTYRLPTVAEWRAACATGYPVETTVDDRAWHAGNAGRTTHPVAKKTANVLGLHDMAGNVAEWCLDENGKPVAMGGSYRDEADLIGCEASQRQKPAWNASDPQIPKSAWWLADCSFVGFRIACVEIDDAGVQPD